MSINDDIILSFSSLICIDLAMGESVPRGKCLLDCIAVEDGYRGKGIGKILLDRSEYEARSRKCSVSRKKSRYANVYCCLEELLDY